MAIDTMEKQSSVVLDSSKQAGGVGANLLLHPLPILNISDHLTRARLQAGNDQGVRVYGALLGTQNGRELEIHNTFEFKVINAPQGNTESSQPPKIEHDFFKRRQAQFKQTFPTFDFLGWYSNGPVPTTADINVHKQLLEYNETPIFLQLSPSQASIASASRAGELPLQVYETHLEMASQPAAGMELGEGSQGAQIFFVQSSYKINTGEAERIAVDHTSKPSGSEGAGASSTIVASLTTQQSAIRMLSDRISLCLSYVRAVRQGQAPRDPETLRSIKAILAGMPAMDSAEFKEEFLREYNDVLLTGYLASLTKGMHSLNELLDKHDLVCTHGSIDRGMGGFGDRPSGRAARDRMRGNRKGGVD